MSDKQDLTRRQFVGAMTLGATSLALGSGCVLSQGFFFGVKFPGSGPQLGPHQFPVAAITGAKQTGFSGDDYTRAHAFLWQKAQTLAARGGIPSPSETAVVVGGGVSGLSSAYLLRDKNPIVLEQASQFGGNSRGEVWGNSRFSIGAAYLSPPDEDGDIMNLFRELGIDKELRVHKSHDGGSFIQDGTIREGFWHGTSDPARAADFERVYKKMGEVNETRYPDIPHIADGQLSLAELHELDSISFADWLKKELGSVHPHALEYFEQYCWSTYGGSINEVSAAQTLAFVASDVSSMAAFPGGNSAISQALVKKLADALPAGNMRTGALVVDVSVQRDGVAICYEQADGKLKTILAKACVFSSAKFIAKKVITGIPQEQLDAIAKLKWRAYLVANVLLKKKVPSPGFDCFRLVGRFPADTAAESQSRPFTDMIYASWAESDRCDHSVLTLYKGIPHDGGRADLFAPDSYERHRKSFEDAIPEIAKIAGISPDQIEGIRLTRWGHPMPLAQVGLLSSGIAQKAHQPVGGRIFFSQQDNWCSPAFEPSFASAQETAKQVRSVLS